MKVFAVLALLLAGAVFCHAGEQGGVDSRLKVDADMASEAARTALLNVTRSIDRRTESRKVQVVRGLFTATAEYSRDKKVIVVTIEKDGYRFFSEARSCENPESKDCGEMVLKGAAEDEKR